MCIPLKNIKESYPINVSEYTKAKKINYEPYFISWVPYTLRKQYRIIAAVSSIVNYKTHKYVTIVKVQ